MSSEQTADFEKLGVFYLGREYDASSGERTSTPLLYDSRDLVTHAICVGMTGSGKTGLCVGLIEEAAIDGIPAIVIDPKGDLANLLLTFPSLTGEEFEPWVSDDEARRAGLDRRSFATREAARWKEGLASWGQDGARIEALRRSAKFMVYTPGSRAGVPISVLRSFEAPEPAVMNDPDLRRERVQTSVTGLLALAGVNVDPVRSREHILLSTIVDRAWSDGIDLDLGALVSQVQAPPFDRVGVMQLDAFFPQHDRFALAMALNGLLASPSFAAWSEGEPLDIGAMLYTKEGKPKISVVSIAHLSDAERMFFVSMLFTRVLGWTRQQAGTTSLRAIVYMDEIAGYCPPNGAPPSKAPLLTLMKQARAYGVGIVLATQNPVDLDYKSLSNAGTWLIGRLQTDQDKARVLDGLEGASSNAASGFDRTKIDALLSRLAKRVFLLHNVHDDGPTLFESRWAMSYLRGPMTREQIKVLTEASDVSQPLSSHKPMPARPAAGAGTSTSATTRPVLPPAVPQYVLPVSATGSPGAALEYRPFLYGSAMVFFNDAKLGVSETRPILRLTLLSDGPVVVDWHESDVTTIEESELSKDCEDNATFAPLPPQGTSGRNYDRWLREFGDAVYRDESLILLRCAETDEVSAPGEAEGAFRIRIRQAMREQRDAAAEKLRQKYGAKLELLRERLRRAENTVEVQKAQASDAKMGTAISMGSAVLGAIFGRKKLGVGTVGRAGTAARSAGRASREAGDVARAEESVEVVREKLASLEAELEGEIAEVMAIPADGGAIEQIALRAKKANVKVRLVTLAWAPFWVAPGREAVKAWE